MTDVQKAHVVFILKVQTVLGTQTRDLVILKYWRLYFKSSETGAYLTTKTP